MLRDQFIICDSNIPWHHNRYSKHHLMSRLARENDVVFVNPQVDALKYAGEHGWSQTRFGARFSYPEGEKLEVFQSLAVPRRGSAQTLLKLDERFLCRQLRGIIRRHGGRPPILFIGNPWNVFLVDAFPESPCTIYHCSDNFPAGFSGGLRTKIEQREAELIRRVDVVACTHERLRQKCLGLGGKAHLVPHAVDESVFRTEDIGPEPSDLKDVPRPRAIYVGSLDHLIDFDLIADVARMSSEFHFILVGPVAEDCRESLNAIVQLPNIRWLGPKPWTELAPLLWHSDVGIMPFLVTDWTATGSPLKLFEYLAAGLPVVSTRIHEFPGQVSAFVRVADTSREFSEHTESAHSENSSEQTTSRMDAVRSSYTWTQRAQELGALIEDVLQGDSGRHQGKC